MRTIWVYDHELTITDDGHVYEGDKLLIDNLLEDLDFESTAYVSDDDLTAILETVLYYDYLDNK